MRIAGARALHAVLVRDEVFSVETQAAVQLVIVKENQSRPSARCAFDVTLEAVVLVACRNEQR